jgi:molybdate transport system substrate-binding protein
MLTLQPQRSPRLPGCPRSPKLQRLFLYLLIFTFLVGVGGCTDDKQDTATLTVFAAASLREVVEDAARRFEEREGVKVVLNIAGSNVLAQQILAVPAADVFLSADGNWVDVLEQAGRVRPAERQPWLSNRLVVIGRQNANITLADAADLARAARADGFQHLAVANPEAVPAGRYARAALEGIPWPTASGSSTVWDGIQDRLAPTLDVRAALALVESDPAILGIVYRTDARTSERVRILLELPPPPEAPILYHAALLQDGPNPALGRRFLEFLESPEVHALAARRGFLPPDS